jgi:hypothetical protein
LFPVKNAVISGWQDLGEERVPDNLFDGTQAAHMTVQAIDQFEGRAEAFEERNEVRVVKASSYLFGRARLGR